MVVNGESRNASSAIISRSQVSASDKPIPAADPGTAAITGFGMEAIVAMTGRYSYCSLPYTGRPSRPDFRSAPALKQRPSPVRTTARIESS